MSAAPLSVPITLVRTGVTIAEAEVAATSTSRRRGLLGRNGLDVGHGLLITPCGSVHTFFMRFPIDVVFLDRDRRVRKVVERLRPGRLAWGGWRAWQTLELAAGAIAAAGLRRGDRLIW